LKAVFVLETVDYKWTRGLDQSDIQGLTGASLISLERVSNAASVEADIVFAVEDQSLAGKAKAKIGIQKIRKERDRVLSEISHYQPDFIMCFGPVATASVFNHGNLAEKDLFRQAHYPLGADRPPVYVTVSLNAARWRTGLQKWLEWDVIAAVKGWGQTEWGDYKILQPGTPEWNRMPDELWDRCSRQAPIPQVVGIEPVGLDLETFPGTDPWHPNARIRMVVVTNQIGKAWIVQATSDSQLPYWLKSIIGEPLGICSGSNIKFDYLWLRRFGYRMQNMWCTSMHEHIIDGTNPRTDLKNLAFQYVPKLADYDRDLKLLIKERGGWEHITDEEMYQYAGGDGEASIGAALGQMPVISANFERPARLFRQLYAVFAEMEHNGACVDLDVTRELAGLYEVKLQELREKIVAILGPVNPNSPVALAPALKKAIPNINLRVKEWQRIIGDDDDEDISTKRQILERERHKHPVLDIILEFRSYRTRYSTFIKGVLEKYAKNHHGAFYIHPSFHLDRTETYRSSSSNPNGQNYPKGDDDPVYTIKRQFVSRFPRGQILDADQSQIEIRMAAWLSGDTKMISAIESGEDIHAAMASQMLGKPEAQITEKERDECKARTFLILYGGGGKKLAQDLGIPTKEANKMIREYYETFQGLKHYIDKTRQQVMRDLQVETPFGFIRQFAAPDHWNSAEGWLIQRQAFNTKVQNTAWCVTACALVVIQNEIEKRQLKSKLILQVHDNAIVDVYPGELDEIANIVKWAMEIEAPRITREDYGININIPLQCNIKVGKNWGQTQPLEVL
jgi:DNA polymerase I-like protein with 3'-5' exonuclease and polymerase domains